MPLPRLQPVDSSAIARIGYDAKGEEAYVEFHDSDVYVYCGVPPPVFEEFARADSKGTFLNMVIKPRFPFRKA
jgi:lysyl-tRNA synthetase class 2